MGARENIALITRHLEAVRAKDEDRYASVYAEDAVVRTAGVPRALGGVLEGRVAIAASFRGQARQALDVREILGSDTHVCVVAKRSSIFSGTEFLRANDLPYSTYECIVYEIEGGSIRQETSYVNWLDVYVQVGLVDLADLIA